jgi:hypothetical protein
MVLIMFGRMIGTVRECEGRAVVGYIAKETAKQGIGIFGRRGWLDMRRRSRSRSIETTKPLLFLRPQYPFTTPLSSHDCLPHDKHHGGPGQAKKDDGGRPPTVDRVMGAPRREPTKHASERCPSSDLASTNSSQSANHRSHLLESSSAQISPSLGTAIAVADSLMISEMQISGTSENQYGLLQRACHGTPSLSIPLESFWKIIKKGTRQATCHDGHMHVAKA